MESTKLSNSFYPDIVNGFLNQSLATIPQNQRTDTMIINNRYYAISNDRSTLSWSYNTHSFIRTMIDQPIHDAFTKGIIIDSGQLDPNDIQKFYNAIEQHDIINKFKQACIWAELFGGAGLVINIGGDPKQILNIEDIDKNTSIDFYPADLWELSLINMHSYGDPKPYIDDDITIKFNREVAEQNIEQRPEHPSMRKIPYIFYGVPLHQSRVIPLRGDEVPSLNRPIYKGWGASRLEETVAPINAYLKARQAIFSYLDKSLIEIYKIKDFNMAGATIEGSIAMQQRLRLSNQLKNYENAIIIDTLDDFQQMTIDMNGINTMLEQVNKDLCMALRTPFNKLFGDSATGFSSGEDAMENYNSMIESKVRTRYNRQLLLVLKILSKKIFGYVVDDLQLSFHPLRVLNAEQEENIKDKKFTRIIELYDRGLIKSKEVIQQINLADIFDTEIEEKLKDDFPMPPPQQPTLNIRTQQDQLSSKDLGLSNSRNKKLWMPKKH